ncbi:MAG: hypothetical protein WC693_02920 [Patescibacteria group bacterium]|jgi:hypothetical protein
MLTVGQAGLLVLCLVALIAGALLYVWWWARKMHAAARADYEERSRPNRLEYEAWLAEEKKTASYILTHKPTRWQIQEILQNPASLQDKELAIKTALGSGNIHTISLIHDFAPEAGPRAVMASLDMLFSSITAEEALGMLKKWEALETLNTPYRDWWKAWKPRLAAKAQPAIDRQRAEEEAARLAALRVSSSEDDDDDDEEPSSYWDDDDDDYWEPEPTDWSSG